jgi:integrase
VAVFPSYTAGKSWSQWVALVKVNSNFAANLDSWVRSMDVNVKEAKKKLKKASRRMRGSGGVFVVKGVNYFYVSYKENGATVREKSKFLARFCENCENTKPCSEHETEYAENKKAAAEYLKQVMDRQQGRLKGKLLGEDDDLTYEVLRNYYLLRAERIGERSVARVTSFEGTPSKHILTDEIKNDDGYLRVNGQRWLDEYFSGRTTDDIREAVFEFPEWRHKQADAKAQLASRTEYYVKKFIVRDSRAGRTTTRDIVLSEAKKAALDSQGATTNRLLGVLQGFFKWYSKRGSRDDRRPFAYFREDEALVVTPVHIETEIQKGRGTKKTSRAAGNVSQDLIRPDEYRKLLAALPERLRPVVMFLHATGFRSGEASTLPWEWLRFDKKGAYILVDAGYLKNEEPLAVSLDGELAALVPDLLSERDNSKRREFVFDAVNLDHEWNKACDAVGLGVWDSKTHKYSGIGPHSLRHTAITEMVKLGVPSQTISAMTGHKDISQVDRYNVTTREAVAAAMRKRHESGD